MHDLQGVAYKYVGQQSPKRVSAMRGAIMTISMQKYFSIEGEITPGEREHWNGKCMDYRVPAVIIEGKGKLATISWDILWLELKVREGHGGKLTPLGIEVEQLFERCQIPLSQKGIADDGGHFIDIPSDWAIKVAEELYDIFNNAQHQRAEDHEGRT